MKNENQARSQDHKIEEFAEQQLAKARKNLRVTQFITVIVAVLAVFYLYVYSQLKPWMDPNYLSQEALLLVKTHVNENARDYSNRLLTEYPRLLTNGIAQLRSKIPERYSENAEQAEKWLSRMAQPDSDMAQTLIDDMPRYRESVEEDVRTIFAQHTDSALDELNTSMDELLDNHKDAVLKLMENNKDQESLDVLNKEMGEEIKYILLAQKINNETADEKLSKSLGFLEQISTKMVHMAKNDNLSNDELRIRRALAVVLDKIQYVRPNNPDTGLDIDDKDSGQKSKPPSSAPKEKKKKPNRPKGGKKRSDTKKPSKAKKRGTPSEKPKGN